MASNRAQRRAAKRKGKLPGETYADQLAKQRMIKEAVNKAAHDESVLLKSDIMTQRLLWMSIEALNRAFGFAGIRAQRFMLTLDEVREDIEEMARENGWDYAVEKLRQRCEQITGMEVKQVHEEAMLQARRENEAKGIFFDADDPEDMASVGFVGARETGPKWIPVTERLPDLDGCYLCNIRSDAFKGCFYREILRFERGSFMGECVPDEAVTHWMDLPDCPEGV